MSTAFSRIDGLSTKEQVEGAVELLSFSVRNQIVPGEYNETPMCKKSFQWAAECTGKLTSEMAVVRRQAEAYWPEHGFRDVLRASHSMRIVRLKAPKSVTNRCMACGRVEHCCGIALDLAGSGIFPEQWERMRTAEEIESTTDEALETMGKVAIDDDGLVNTDFGRFTLGRTCTRKAILSFCAANLTSSIAWTLATGEDGIRALPVSNNDPDDTGSEKDDSEIDDETDLDVGAFVEKDPMEDEMTPTLQTLRTKAVVGDTRDDEQLRGRTILEATSVVDRLKLCIANERARSVPNPPPRIEYWANVDATRASAGSDAVSSRTKASLSGRLSISRVGQSDEYEEEDCREAEMRFQNGKDHEAGPSNAQENRPHRLRRRRFCVLESDDSDDLDDGVTEKTGESRKRRATAERSERAARRQQRFEQGANKDDDAENRSNVNSNHEEQQQVSARDSASFEPTSSVEVASALRRPHTGASGVLASRKSVMIGLTAVQSSLLFDGDFDKAAKVAAALLTMTEMASLLQRD